MSVLLLIVVWVAVAVAVHKTTQVAVRAYHAERHYRANVAYHQRHYGHDITDGRGLVAEGRYQDEGTP